MADHRRHYEDEPRYPQRDWSDRSHDEARTWFGDDKARQRHGNDERDERFPYGGDRSSIHDRGSRWDGPRDIRDDSYEYAGAATGAYRTDDRDYHDRHIAGPRADRYRSDGYYRDREHRDHGDARLNSYWNGRGRAVSRDQAADEYYRAADQQREDFLRYEAQSPGADWEERHGESGPPSPRRERGGYWRRYEVPRAHYVGRGPKDYQRSDDRVREEICDCMTDDPMLDASEITVQVSNGEVTLCGLVTSREQKRRAEDVAERISGVKDVTNQLRVSREPNGHSPTATQPVSQASGKGTPSKSTSGTSA